MTLRKKILIISGVAILCLNLSLLFVMDTILMNGFSVLEKKDMGKNIIRAQNALDMEKQGIDSMLSDWAFWDDAYDFMENKNEGYIKKNLNDVTFSTQQLNFVMYLDLDGNIVYGRGFDLEKKVFKQLPKNFLFQTISKKQLLAINQSDNGMSGIVVLPEGTVLLAIKPIRDTDKQKPARGTMIAGRYLTSQEFANLAETAQLSLSAYQIDQDMPEDFLSAKSLISESSSSVIKTLNDETIAGYTVLMDVYRKPAMLLRVDTKRDIYMQGKNTLGYVIVVLVVIGILFGGINLLFLEKTILFRLAHLSKQVIDVGKQGNPAMHIDVSGKDELTELSGALNTMLKSLSLVQNELRTSEIINRVLLDGIPDSLLRLDHNGIIIDFKTGRSRLSASSPRMLPGRGISECYPEAISKVFMKKIHEALESNTQQTFEYELSVNHYSVFQEVRIDTIGENEVIAIIRDFG
jgi:sensor domain CHASE-containing protein